MEKKFVPNCVLVDLESGESEAFLRCGYGAAIHYVSEDVWYEGGRCLMAWEAREWGLEERPLPGGEAS